MIETSIVIVTYGHWSVTERCLYSLRTALAGKLGTSWEIIVVDNCSPDDTQERLLEWSDRIRIELLSENRNFSGGCNIGADRAAGEVLIFLNNDTEVPPGTLEPLADQVREQGVAAAGCRLLFPEGTVQHAGVAFLSGCALSGAAMPQHVFRHQDQSLAATLATFEADSVTAACIAVAREPFRSVGGFDERYRNGLEDIDLCLKLRDAGHRIVYRGDISIIHHEGSSRGRGAQLFETAAKLDAMRYNDSLFCARWAERLDQDDELASRIWGARLRDHQPMRTNVPIADVLLAGSVSGIGPASDEARALLLALAAIGHVPCVADAPQPNLVAPLDALTEQLLDAALRITCQPGARQIYVPAGEHDELYQPNGRVVPGPHAQVRLATSRTALALENVDGVLVASRAVAKSLCDQGLAGSKIRVLPPLLPKRACGPGGRGLLIALPVHLPRLAASVLEAAASLPPSVPARILPSVSIRGLQHIITSRAPLAELLAPCASEDAFAPLASTADLFLSADPSDFFERRALVAASTGTQVLSLKSDGPILDLLGPGAVTSPSDLKDNMLTRLGEEYDRTALMSCIASECDLRRLAQFV